MGQPYKDYPFLLEIISFFLGLKIGVYYFEEARESLIFLGIPSWRSLFSLDADRTLNITKGQHCQTIVLMFLHGELLVRIFDPNFYDMLGYFNPKRALKLSAFMEHSFYSSIYFLFALRDHSSVFHL